MAEQNWRLDEARSALQKTDEVEGQDRRNLVLTATRHLIAWLGSRATLTIEEDEDDFDAESEASRHG